MRLSEQDEMPIDAATLREWAVRASVDPRTMARVIRGERVRGMAYGRAVRVLRAEGIEPLNANTASGARAHG